MIKSACAAGNLLRMSSRSAGSQACSSWVGVRSKTGMACLLEMIVEAASLATGAEDNSAAA
eukprot:4375879-Pleurochrysis_carterae.AAC.1